MDADEGHSLRCLILTASRCSSAAEVARHFNNQNFSLADVAQLVEQPFRKWQVQGFEPPHRLFIFHNPLPNAHFSTGYFLIQLISMYLLSFLQYPQGQGRLC